VLAAGASAGDSVEIVAYLPRGLSDGYLKSESDSRFLSSTDGSVTTAKLAANAITTAKITDANVTTAKIADANVTAAKLASGAAVSNIGYTPVNKAGDTMTGPLKMDSTAINIVSGNNHSLRFYKDNTDYNAGNAMWAVYGAYSDGTMYFTRYGGNPVSQSPADLLALRGNGDLALPLGNLVLGSGKGIDFSASSNAGGATSELLDDYEFGSFTPTFGGYNTKGSASSSGAGRYVKVGRQVTCWIYWSGSITGASTDYFSVYDLPFTTANFGGVVETGGSIGYQSGLDMGANGRGWWLYPANNTTKALMGVFTQTSVTQVNPNTSIGGIYLTITYLSA
jgi:hypothetical protein